jgi:hypothetical protein
MRVADVTQESMFTIGRRTKSLHRTKSRSIEGRSAIAFLGRLPNIPSKLSCDCSDYFMRIVQHSGNLATFRSTRLVQLQRTRILPPATLTHKNHA